jgi:hypothetical protein
MIPHRRINDDCASDLQLDLLHQGALSAPASDAWHQHMASCAACAARWQVIHTHVDLPMRDQPTTRQPLRVVAWGAPVLAAAAALAFMVRTPNTPTTSIKGSFGIDVVVGTTATAVGTNDSVHPGDVLSVFVHSDAPAFVALWSTTDQPQLLLGNSAGVPVPPGRTQLPLSLHVDNVGTAESLLLWRCADASLMQQVLQTPTAKHEGCESVQWTRAKQAQP